MTSQNGDCEHTGCPKKILSFENVDKRKLTCYIDCKHISRAVSVLTFGSFTLYNYNFTIVSFLDVSKRLFNERYLNGFMIISYPSRYVVIKCRL